LWGEGVEGVAVPDGFVMLMTGAVAFVLVACWLARLGGALFGDSTPAERQWLGSRLVVVVLLIPAGACWFAVRAVWALAGGVPRVYTVDGWRRSRAVVWVVWALSCSAQQIMPLWWLIGNSYPGTDLAPDLAFAMAGLANAVSMVVLMWSESAWRPGYSVVVS